MPDEDFDALFTRDHAMIFLSHGYTYLIHRPTSRRANHADFHLQGFREKGTTTPFDMAVMNEREHFHLAQAVVRYSDKIQCGSDDTDIGRKFF